MTLEEIKKAQERINSSLYRIHCSQIKQFDDTIDELRERKDKASTEEERKIYEFGMRLFKSQRDTFADTTPPLVKW